MIHKIKTISSKLAFALALAMIATQAMAVGAIAIDSNHGSRYGFSYDYPTRAQAEQRALNECGYGCQVVLDFDTGCGAYAADQASGSSVYGWGTSTSRDGAQNRALSECKAQGGSRCIIRVWGCNSR